MTTWDWPLRMRATLDSLLELLAQDPALASMALVEGLRAGRRIAERYQAAVEELGACLREEAPAPPDGGELPAAVDEAVVGGIAFLLARAALARRAEQLDELTPQIVEFALTPYLGASAARRVISAG